MAYLLLKRNTEAEEDFAEAIRLDPDGNYGLLARANLSRVKKDFPTAISAFSEVLRRVPDWSGGYLNRARCYALLKQYDNAIKDLTKAVESANSQSLLAVAHLERGETFAAAGKTDEALKDLGIAIQTNSGLATRVYQLRGAIFASRREWSQAAGEWGSWAALAPNASAFHQQGDAFDNAGHSDKAIEAYTKALDLERDPKLRGEIYVDRAAAFSNLGNWIKAIEDYAQALQLDLNASTYRRRGSALVLAGRIRDAISDLRKANELDPKDSYAVLWLAIAEAKAGKFNADELKNLAKSLDPKWPQPIVNVLLNDTAPAQPQDADASSELHKQGRKCEFEFYVGALRLAQGNREEGVRRLRAAIESGAKEYIEYHAAETELKNLGLPLAAAQSDSARS